MKRRLILIFVSTCALLTGCGKGGNVNVAGSNTSNAAAPAASPKATAEAAKTAPEPGRAQSSKATKPEDAAGGLFNAWKTKDRAAASGYATSDAITSLFSEGGPEGLQFQGCDKQGDGYLCGYSYEGGGLLMTVEGSDSEGYKVTSTNFIAD